MQKQRIKSLITLLLVVLLPTIACFGYYHYRALSAGTSGLPSSLVILAYPIALLSFALIAADIGKVFRLPKAWLSVLYALLLSSVLVLAVF